MKEGIKLAKQISLCFSSIRFRESSTKCIYNIYNIYIQLWQGVGGGGRTPAGTPYLRTREPQQQENPQVILWSQEKLWKRQRLFEGVRTKCHMIQIFCSILRKVLAKFFSPVSCFRIRSTWAALIMETQRRVGRLTQRVSTDFHVSCNDKSLS